MSRSWSVVVVVSSVVALVAGLGIVGTGHAYGWLLVATGLLNTVLGALAYRKAARQTTGSTAPPRGGRARGR